MTKTVLFLLDKLQWLFKFLGVDYASLRSIVEVKMIMENRRVHGIQKNRPQKDKEDNNTFVKSLGFQALFSFLFGAIVLAIDKTVYNIYLWNFAFIMFMIAFNMISDFIEVLFDTTDNIILIPRPVDSKVIWMARLIHITIFILTLTFANSLGSLVFTIAKLGIVTGIMYFFSVILLCLITVFITGILYLLLTKFVSGERLKDIIGYAQIFFSIALMIGYQLGSNMISKLLFVQTLDIKWWHYLAPPAWFAGIMEAYVNRHFETPYFIFVVLVLTIPFLSLYLMNRYLSPLFAKSLSEYGTPDNVEKEVVNSSKSSLSSFLAKILTKNSLEKAAFIFVWKVTNRDRKFKIRAYPIFGLQIYFIAKLFFDVKQQEFSKWMALYYTAFCVFLVVQQIFVSDDWKAAWIFRNAPVDKPGLMLLGGIKAILIKLAIPVFVVVGTIFIYKYGIGMLDDIIFAFVNTLLFIGANIFTGNFSMPFSQSITDSSKMGKKSVNIILLLFVVPILGGIHYFISKTTYGVIILTPIFLGIAIILFSEYRKISWDKIRD
jgi:ABC-2 type transport system permease protein